MLEFAEARAYADLMRAAPREWNWQADESGTATVLIAPTLDIPLFNRVIGLGVAGTHPSHRRRGAQGALTARRVQDGIAMACKWFRTGIPTSELYAPARTEMMH